MLNARERFAAVLLHQEPDRVPYNLLLYPQLAKQLDAELGAGVDYRDFYGEDIRIVAVDYLEHSEIRLADNYFPLPSIAALEKARRESEAVKERGLVTVNSYMPGIFEHAKAFTNDEFALTNMLLDPDDMRKIVGKIADWLCRLYELYAKVGFDICFNGDDIGTQQSTIMGIQSYREFYKENHKRIIQTIKGVNPDAKVAFHCCGHVHTILPEWIDIGLDIIQSLQPEANDLEYLKNAFGKDITFWGAIGLQSNLFYLSPEEIDDEMRRCISIMAPGGGFVASTANFATDEVSIEKIKQIYRSLAKYGKYDKTGDGKTGDGSLS